MGPTSRCVLPQKLHVLVRLRRTPPGPPPPPGPVPEPPLPPRGPSPPPPPFEPFLRSDIIYASRKCRSSGEFDRQKLSTSVHTPLDLIPSRAATDFLDFHGPRR